MILRAVIVPHHADVDICTVENPGPVALCKENVACFFDALQDFAVRSATNALRCQQASALALAMLDLLARLFKPVAAKVRLSGDAVTVNTAQFFNVAVTKFAAHKLV